MAKGVARGSIHHLRQMLRAGDILLADIVVKRPSKVLLLYRSSSLSPTQAQLLVQSWEADPPAWLLKWLQPADAITEPFCTVSISSNGSSSSSSSPSITRMDPVVRKRPTWQLLQEQEAVFRNLQQGPGDARLQRLQQQIRELPPLETFSSTTSSSSPGSSSGGGSRAESITSCRSNADSGARSVEAEAGSSSTASSLDAAVARLLAVLAAAQQREAPLTDEEAAAVALAAKAVAAALVQKKTGSTAGWSGSIR